MYILNYLSSDPIANAQNINKTTIIIKITIIPPLKEDWYFDF